MRRGVHDGGDGLDERGVMRGVSRRDIRVRGPVRGVRAWDVPAGGGRCELVGVRGVSGGDVVCLRRRCVLTVPKGYLLHQPGGDQLVAVPALW